MRINVVYNVVMERFNLTDQKGHRDVIRGCVWNRKVATEALDMYQYVYKYKRKNVRFDHKS